MEKLYEIIKKIEAPLVFVSRDSFRHLNQIKDLENVMQTLLQSLTDTVQTLTMPPDEINEFKIIISSLEKSFSGFDHLSFERKRVCIESANRYMDHLNRLVCRLQTNNSQTPAEMSSEKPVDVKTCFDRLSTPIQYIKGVGPKIAALLERKNIKVVEDLLYFIPRKYEDRRIVRNIQSAGSGKRETVIGNVVRTEIKYYGKKKVFEVTIDDGESSLTAKWFKGNQTYLKNIFKKGKRVIVTGEVSNYFHSKNMIHPDFEVLDEDENDKELLHFKRIVPVYSETEGLHQKYMRRIIAHAIENYSQFIMSPIPKEICTKRRLADIHDAIRNVHFPGINENIDTFNEMKSWAHRRLIYDEFFFFQLGMALKRKGNILDKGIAFKTGGELIRKFNHMLPFRLTEAQRRVIDEIERDMAKSSSMNRLLQGDVGCGKTVVSMAAMITACENGYQAAIMAPTEILAGQHYDRIKSWGDQLDLKVALLTGDAKNTDKIKILNRLKKKDIHIIVGTHALIQESVAFGNLGLVVVDEQHRFGVIQRATIRKKGINPDVLVMTATPIPRTLAMTVYGDLDMSVIDEYPPGKIEIRTKVFSDDQRDRVYEIMRKELNKENQIFVVYPLVEESETLDLKDATNMAEFLGKEIFPDYRLGLIHGRMKGKEKDAVMTSFKNREIDILVSTTVIEVGIDIPQASLMVIEHAERFGLSQLHQLRGRVGRSGIPSYCILMVHRIGSEDAEKRLRIMEKTNDGFRIAEEDLSIRGPGELMGTRQSGLPDFRIAHIIRDSSILSEAKNDAFSLIEEDPTLKRNEHLLLKEILLQRWGGRLDLAKTG